MKRGGAGGARGPGDVEVPRLGEPFRLDFAIVLDEEADPDKGKSFKLLLPREKQHLDIVRVPGVRRWSSGAHQPGQMGRLRRAMAIQTTASQRPLVFVAAATRTSRSTRSLARTGRAPSRALRPMRQGSTPAEPAGNSTVHISGDCGGAVGLGSVGEADCHDGVALAVSSLKGFAHQLFWFAMNGRSLAPARRGGEPPWRMLSVPLTDTKCGNNFWRPSASHCTKRPSTQRGFVAFADAATLLWLEQECGDHNRMPTKRPKPALSDSPWRPPSSKKDWASSLVERQKMRLLLALRPAVSGIERQDAMCARTLGPSKHLPAQRANFCCGSLNVNLILHPQHAQSTGRT